MDLLLSLGVYSRHGLALGLTRRCRETEPAQSHHPISQQNCTPYHSITTLPIHSRRYSPIYFLFFFYLCNFVIHLVSA
jgi:hypothetical protein